MHVIQAYLVLRQVMDPRRFLILAGPDRLLPLGRLGRMLLGTTFFAQKRVFLDPGGEQEGKDVLVRHTHAEVCTLPGHGVQSLANV